MYERNLNSTIYGGELKIQNTCTRVLEIIWKLCRIIKKIHTFPTGELKLNLFHYNKLMIHGGSNYNPSLHVIGHSSPIVRS
jgi:hypothetical protein